MIDDPTLNQEPYHYRGEEKKLDIPKDRMKELIRHYAEIQRYQKENDLQDKGDPPEDDTRDSKD